MEFLIGLLVLAILVLGVSIINYIMCPKDYDCDNCDKYNECNSKIKRYEP